MTKTVTAGIVEEDPDTIDLMRLLETIWNGKWLILFWTVLGVLLGVFLFITTPKVYQADALIQLENKASQIGSPSALLGLEGINATTTTEVEIIKSRLVLGQAVSKRHLDWRAEPVLMPVIGVAVQRYGLFYPDIMARFPSLVPYLPDLDSYAQPDTQIGLDLLQVDADWIQSPMTLKIVEQGAFIITLPNSEVLSGRVGALVTNADGTFALRVGALTGAVGREFIIMQRDEASTIAGLRNALTVTEKGRRSGILNLQYKSGNPDDAKRILNAISEAYIKQNIDRGVANANSGLDFLNLQLPIAEKEVRKAEQELNDFRREEGVVDLSFESASLLTGLESINTDLQSLTVQEDEVKQRYTRNHPVYQQLLNKRLRLEAQIDLLRKETDALPETQRKILNMSRNLEIAQEIYNSLQSQVQSTQVIRASNIGSVRIIDLAQSTGNAISPRRSRTLALYLVFGGMVGVASVFLRSWLRRGVQAAEQIEAMGLPVFATVNYVKTADISLKKKNESHPILALDDPTSLATEAFRSLRTSLHFGMLDASSKSIVITSAAPVSGKSFSAVNLAVVLAQGGQRVCLIDADLRRGHLRKYFNQPKNAYGLSQYLAEEKTLDEVIHKGPIDGISFIGSGRFPPNPADLLMRPKLVELLTCLEKDFDLILIDTPPVMAVTDPVIVGRITGGTLIVARYGVTQLAEIQATQHALEGAGVNIIGAILNGYDPTQKGSQYSYKKSYRYEYLPRPD